MKQTKFLVIEFYGAFGRYSELIIRIGEHGNLSILMSDSAHDKFSESFECEFDESEFPKLEEDSQVALVYPG